MTLSLLPPGAGSPTYSTALVTDETGIFTATGVPGGVYDIRVKGSHTLSRKTAQVAIVGGTNRIAWNQALREGDADNDNRVAIADFSMLRLALGKAANNPGFDARADFNQDGLITIADYSLMRANFAQAGE